MPRSAVTVVTNGVGQRVSCRVERMSVVSEATPPVHVFIMGPTEGIGFPTTIPPILGSDVVTCATTTCTSSAEVHRCAAAVIDKGFGQSRTARPIEVDFNVSFSVGRGSIAMECHVHRVEKIHTLVVRIVEVVSKILVRPVGACFFGRTRQEGYKYCQSSDGDEGLPSTHDRPVFTSEATRFSFSSITKVSDRVKGSAPRESPIAHCASVRTVMVDATTRFEVNK